MIMWAEGFRRLGMIASVLAFGVVIGWTTAGWRHDAATSRLQAAAEHERAEAFRWVAAEQKRSAATMAVEDARATGEVNHAKQETERLLGCIERGDGCGLRVRVVRTAAKCRELPEAGTTPGVGDRGGEWAELDPATRSSYRALRERLPVIEQALKVCVNAAQQP